VPSEATAPVTAASTDYDGRDRVAFEAIRDSTRARDFAVFLQRFPESVLAPFAQSRLEELAERTTAALSPPIPSVPPTQGPETPPASGRRDEPAEVAQLRKAADQGEAVAQASLGWRYDQGRGVAKDDAEAVRWYREAADQGNALAKQNLARLDR
jgi:Sel1 repeat